MSDCLHPLAKRHAGAAAKLHQHRISTGFLSSLGPFFLKQLYAAITSCASGFGYVWEDPDGNVLGFVACAENTGKLYKQALLHRGILLGVPLIRHALRPRTIRRILETLRYPGEVTGDLPDAEILSIAVSQQCGRRGIGKSLIRASLEEFARRGITRVRVAVWAGNESANKFYSSCGFTLSMTRKHHGLPMNVYVAETQRTEP